MSHKDPEKAREYNRKWRAANREKKRESDRKWCAANREKKRESDRKWRAANPEKARECARKWRAANPEKKRENLRKWRAANREKQREYSRRINGLPEPTRPCPAACECCGGPPGKKALHLDHDHTLPREHALCFRGWLCGRCNTAIGSLGDNIAGLKCAVAYLKRAEGLPNRSTSVTTTRRARCPAS